jgi:hypothetical protein
MEEQDARSYAGDDMADMHLHDDDDFLSRRVVLREEQHKTNCTRSCISPGKQNRGCKYRIKHLQRDPVQGTLCIPVRYF